MSLMGLRSYLNLDSSDLGRAKEICPPLLHKGAGALVRSLDTAGQPLSCSVVGGLMLSIDSKRSITNIPDIDLIPRLYQDFSV